MTFDEFEVSTEDGAPVELWEFMLNGVTERYTSAGYDVVHESQTYVSVKGLEHSEIEDSGEMGRNNLTLTAPRDFPPQRFFNPVPRSDVLLLTIFRVHRGDGEKKAFWSGRVLNCSKEGIRAIFKAENIYTSLRRQGLRRKFTKSCPHDLYGPECGAPLADHQVAVVVASVNGTAVQAAAFDGYDDGRLAGGFIEWERVPGDLEWRGITTHIGDTIQFTHILPGLVAGMTVKLAPGCKHTKADCNNFFNIGRRFGGWDILGKNPMDGSTNVFLDLT